MFPLTAGRRRRRNPAARRLPCSDVWPGAYLREDNFFQGPLLWLGVRATRKFRVGFFGFFKFRVLKIRTRNFFKINKTRHFGYPTFRVRVRVYPEQPEIQL